MTPTFSVLMGTLGRPTLVNLLDSIKRQKRVTGDQVIVVVDAYEQGDRPDVRRLVHSYGPGFVAASYDAGYHCWGTEQINHAMQHIPITGSHILTVGDDDVYTDGAWANLRTACARDLTQVVLAKFVSPWRTIMWYQQEMIRGEISGCCIAAPRALVGEHPTRNAEGQPYAEHDFDWMQAILAKSGREPLWLDEVIVIARPPKRGQDVVHLPPFRDFEHKRWAWAEDIAEGLPVEQHAVS